MNFMKKILCIISVLLCILLTACGNDSSIGIIGGADGPTSIIVSEKGEKAMYQQITAICSKSIETHFALCYNQDTTQLYLIEFQKSIREICWLNLDN